VVTEKEMSGRGVFANEMSAGGGEIDSLRDRLGSRNGES